MARHERRQSEWAIVKREPVADFAVPDGYFRSSRPVAGPLRTGTAPGVGPRNREPGAAMSDFEMDRVSPRRFDPMGNSLNRAGNREASLLLSRRR